MKAVAGVAMLLCMVGWASGVSAQDRAFGPSDGTGLPAVDTGRVAVGDPAPDFTLAALGRGPVTLSDFRGSKHIILVFYRGYW